MARFVDACQRALGALTLTLASGCFRDVETPFPAGLEPLEAENRAEFPPDQAEALVTWGEATDDFVSVHARGYVHAPLVDVWSALQDADVNTDRRRVSEWTVEPVDDPAVEHSYVIHTTVVEIITVEYDLTWRHGLVEGSADVPEVVGIRWQKTFGAAIIERLEGSITARARGEDLVELEIIEHLGAPNQQPEDIEQFLVDLHADTVAVAHGEALPTYE